MSTEEKINESPLLTPVENTEPETTEAKPETIEIDLMEYAVLRQMATDFGDVISYMQGLQEIFQPKPGEAAIKTPGDMIKLMISKPGRIKKAAHAMAPIITSIAPFVDKYGGKLPTSKSNVDPVK